MPRPSSPSPKRVLPVRQRASPSPARPTLTRRKSLRKVDPSSAPEGETIKTPPHDVETSVSPSSPAAVAPGARAIKNEEHGGDKAPAKIKPKLPTELTGWTEPLAVAGVLSVCGYVSHQLHWKYDVAGTFTPHGEAILSLLPVFALAYSLLDLDAKSTRPTYVMHFSFLASLIIYDLFTPAPSSISQV